MATTQILTRGTRDDLDLRPARAQTDGDKQLFRVLEADWHAHPKLQRERVDRASVWESAGAAVGVLVVIALYVLVVLQLANASWLTY